MVGRISIKHDITVGELVPRDLLVNQKGEPVEDSGALGRYFEQRLMDFGHDINPHAGPDLLGQVEVKSRRFPASSAIHIAKMTPTAIATKPYALSNLRDKMQQWLYIVVNMHDAKVQEVSQLDFMHASTQRWLEEKYERCREAVCEQFKLRGTCTFDYHKPEGNLLYLERAKESNADHSYTFNISADDMRKLHSVSKGAQSLNNKDLFAWG